MVGAVPPISSYAFTTYTETPLSLIIVECQSVTTNYRTGWWKERNSRHLAWRQTGQAQLSALLYIQSDSEFACACTASEYVKRGHHRFFHIQFFLSVFANRNMAYFQDDSTSRFVLSLPFTCVMFNILNPKTYIMYRQL